MEITSFLPFHDIGFEKWQTCMRYLATGHKNELAVMYVDSIERKVPLNA